MGRQAYEDGEAEETPPKTPVEPNGFELTKLRKQLDDTRAKMQGVADEITRLLQDEQRRQRKYE